MNIGSVTEQFGRFAGFRALVATFATMALVTAVACGGGDEEPTAAPTSAPQATAAPTTAPAPTPTADTGPGSLQVRVTDAPGDATAVLVTVSSVQVNVQDAADDADSWITVVEGPETFDLVALEGVEAVLGESELAVGSYGQIRLEVGEVEVVTPDETLLARVPSGSLKLVGGFDIEAGKVTGATIDFDLDQSLVEQGNGGFLFKPVVKLITSKPGDALDEPVPLLGDGDDADEDADEVEPTPAPTPEPTATATPAPTSTPVPPTPTPTPTQSPVGDFFLAIETPELLEAVTSEAEFEVVGRTSIDALVSVNDTIPELDVDGRFRVTVPLEEGINVVEVVASIASGDQFSEVLVIIRE